MTPDGRPLNHKPGSALLRSAGSRHGRSRRPILPGVASGDPAALGSRQGKAAPLAKALSHHRNLLASEGRATHSHPEARRSDNWEHSAQQFLAHVSSYKRAQRVDPALTLPPMARAAEMIIRFLMMY